MYFGDLELENICNCTNVRCLQNPLKLTDDKVKVFSEFQFWCLASSIPRLKCIGLAKLTKVSSIAHLMTCDRYFQIRSNLKVAVDADIPDNKYRCSFALFFNRKFNVNKVFYYWIQRLLRIFQLFCRKSSSIVTPWEYFSLARWLTLVFDTLRSLLLWWIKAAICLHSPLSLAMHENFTRTSTCC